MMPAEPSFPAPRTGLWRAWRGVRGLSWRRELGTTVANPPLLPLPRFLARFSSRDCCLYHARCPPPPLSASTRPSHPPFPPLRPRNGFLVTNRPFLSARAEVAADATRRASEKRAAREAREAAARQRREAFLPGAVFTPEFAANDRVVLRFYGPFGYRCCLVLFLSLL